MKLTITEEFNLSSLQIALLQKCYYKDGNCYNIEKELGGEFATNTVTSLLKLGLIDVILYDYFVTPKGEKVFEEYLKRQQ